MKSLAAFVVLGAHCLLGAQQSTRPPSSAQDGVIIQSAGINASTQEWGDSTSLGAYRISGDGYQRPLRPGKSDSQLGLIWQTTAPASLTSSRESLNSIGGLMRTVFIGETAGWLNDFGYTYSGSLTGPKSYTAWSQIQSYGSASNIRFGDYFDLTFAPGRMANFDFWFNATGTFGPPPTSLTELGGVYTAFNSLPGSVKTSQFLWAGSSISVNTWIPSLSASVPVTTYLVGVEDWRVDRGADGDYNDFLFALQFYGTDGSPVAAIPEPETWAAIAGFVALGFVVLRRFRLRQTY